MYLESLTPISTTNYPLWQATRRLKRSSRTDPPIRDDNECTESYKDKVEAFVKHFQEVFQPFNNRHTNRHFFYTAMNILISIPFVLIFLLGLVLYHLYESINGDLGPIDLNQKLLSQ